jgi:hypothetical protein
MMGHIIFEDKRLDEKPIFHEGWDFVCLEGYKGQTYLVFQCGDCTMKIALSSYELKFLKDAFEVV